MGAHTYLLAASRPDGEGDARALLGAKGTVPLAWSLACADGVEVTAGKIASPLPPARERLGAWIEHLRPHVGPKLVATLEGFFLFLQEHVEEDWLVLDATELEEYAVETIDDTRAAMRRLAESPRAADLSEWGLEVGRDGRLELEGGGSGATYPFFGCDETGDDGGWLVPPEPDDAERDTATCAAMAGFVLVSGARRRSFGTDHLFAHPARGDLVFRVRRREDDLRELTVHGSKLRAREHYDSGALAFGPLRGAARLEAWAAHLAANADLLALPSEFFRADEYWASRAGAALGGRMPPYAPDLEDLRAHVTSRLREALVAFVLDTRATAVSFDLGPLGSLFLEHVRDPSWEPHVRAELKRFSGDGTWRAPIRTYLVSPSDQAAVVDQVLEEEGTRAGDEGWALPWLTRSLSSQVAHANGALVLHLGRRQVAPERFTAGFVVARRRERGQEAPAKLFFRGERMLIVIAEGARLAFRFDVAPFVDATTPLAVSGWWTARSGQRFASVLRVGDRTFTFDNDGALVRG